MKVTIEELFTNYEFADIIDEKWVNQFNKNGKLQTDTKKAIITKLSKYVATFCRIRMVTEPSNVFIQTETARMNTLPVSATGTSAYRSQGKTPASVSYEVWGDQAVEFEKMMNKQLFVMFPDTVIPTTGV